MNIDSDMTRKLWGTKIDFMEPIKSLGKSAQYLAYKLPRNLTRYERKIGSQAGPGISGYFGDLKRKGIHSNLSVLQVISDGKCLTWLLSPEKLLKVCSGTSLVVHWLGICLPMQGTWVWSLIWEDSTCWGAAEPMCHNYWAYVQKLLKPL